MRILHVLIIATVIPVSAMANTTLEDLQHEWSICQYQTLAAKKRVVSVRSAKRPTMLFKLTIPMHRC